jgi:hypothetical protein
MCQLGCGFLKAWVSEICSKLIQVAVADLWDSFLTAGWRHLFLTSHRQLTTWLWTSLRLNKGERDGKSGPERCKPQTLCHFCCILLLKSEFWDGRCGSVVEHTQYAQEPGFDIQHWKKESESNTHSRGSGYLRAGIPGGMNYWGHFKSCQLDHQW